MHALKNFIFLWCFLFLSVCCCVGAGEVKLQGDRTVATASASLSSQPASLEDLQGRVQRLQSEYHDLNIRKKSIPSEIVRFLTSATINLKALLAKYEFEPSEKPNVKLVTIQGLKDRMAAIFQEISPVLNHLKIRASVSQKTSSLLKFTVEGRNQSSFEEQGKLLSIRIKEEEESLKFFNQMFFSLKVLEKVFSSFSQSPVDCIDRMKRELSALADCSSFFMNWNDPVHELAILFKAIYKIVKELPNDEVLLPKPKTEEDFKLFNDRKMLRWKANEDLIAILEGARIFLDVPPLSMAQVSVRAKRDNKMMENNDDLSMQLRYCLRGIEDAHLMNAGFLYDAGSPITPSEKWREVIRYTEAALALFEETFEKDKKQGDGK